MYEKKFGDKLRDEFLSISTKGMHRHFLPSKGRGEDGFSLSKLTLGVVGLCLTGGTLPLIAGALLLIKGAIASKTLNMRYSNLTVTPSLYKGFESGVKVTFTESLKMSFAGFCHFFHKKEERKEEIKTTEPKREETPSIGYIPGSG